MEVNILQNKKRTGEAAADQAKDILRRTIQEKGEATFVAATGASQFEFLEALTEKSTIDWKKTTMFHLDEYIGISENHPASFRKYLKDRLIEKVNPGTVHLIQGDAEDPEAERRRLNEILRGKEVDIAFIGIGENGHLAFNDPPADFETEKPYIIVKLDEKCRKQQVKEGWFDSLEEVPRRAISMSIQQMLKSNDIICIVPESRKAQAVKKSLEGEISPECPASILRKHESVYLYLDEDSAGPLQSFTK